MSKTCCFFGHGNIYYSDRTFAILLSLITNKILEGFDNFIIGTHGNFDSLCLHACREARKEFPHIKIQISITNFNYFKRDLLGISKIDAYYNDVETITYPIEATHYKNKIILNNQCMIDSSSLVICYLKSNPFTNGTLRAINYAKKHHKQIINIYDLENNE